MATGYQDWYRFTYLKDQSSKMYLADIFRVLLEDPVTTEREVIAPGATYYVWNSLTVQAPGRLIIMGNAIILGD